jgi:hypothetical protein
MLLPSLPPSTINIIVFFVSPEVFYSLCGARQMIYDMHAAKGKPFQASINNTETTIHGIIVVLNSPSIPNQ